MILVPSAIIGDKQQYGALECIKAALKVALSFLFPMSVTIFLLKNNH